MLQSCVAWNPAPIGKIGSKCVPAAVRWGLDGELDQGLVSGCGGKHWSEFTNRREVPRSAGPQGLKNKLPQSIWDNRIEIESVFVDSSTVYRGGIFG